MKIYFDEEYDEIFNTINTYIYKLYEKIADDMIKSDRAILDLTSPKFITEFITQNPHLEKEASKYIEATEKRLSDICPIEGVMHQIHRILITN